jgi:hypothetical protein
MAPAQRRRWASILNGAGLQIHKERNQMTKYETMLRSYTPGKFRKLEIFTKKGGRGDD